MTRLIDAEDLKKALTSDTRDEFVFVCLSRVLEKIDNAPTVSPFKPMCKAKDEAICEEMTTDGHCNYLKPCPNKYERPQGECKTCRHRDPEDKKCDCGGQERQGCPFPVSDDYFCKFYEKGGAV